MVEEFLFGGGSAGSGEAAETAVGAEDTVTRDDQGDGVRCKRGADGPGGARVAHLGCQGGVGGRLAEGDLAAG